MNTRVSLAVLVCMLSVAATAVAQPGSIYRGRLEPDAVPMYFFGGTRLERVKSGSPPALPRRFRDAATVYHGEVDWSGVSHKLTVIAGESTSGTRFVCADLNGDGRFEGAEWHTARPASGTA